MSQEHEHDADRKFFRNFAAVIAGLALAGIFFGIVANLYSGGEEGSKSGHFLLMTNQRAERLQPVGQVNTAEASAPTVVAAASGESSSEGRTGEQVVEQVCAACHTTKFMNAPQIGDKEEWEPIVKENSLDTLTERVLKGYNNMPAQSSSVSEAEAHAAIKYMVEDKTGLELKE